MFPLLGPLRGAMSADLPLRALGGDAATFTTAGPQPSAPLHADEAKEEKVLFSLELFADGVSACALRGAQARGAARLAFRLLDYPTVTLPAGEGVAEGGGEGKEEQPLADLTLGVGRSCLFAERPSTLARLLAAAPLYLLLVDAMDEDRPRLVAAGSVRVGLLPEESPLAGRFLRQEAPLYTPMGAPAGVARLRMRLARHGAAMLRAVRAAAGGEVADAERDEATTQTASPQAMPAQVRVVEKVVVEKSASPTGMKRIEARLDSLEEQLLARVDKVAAKMDANQERARDTPPAPTPSEMPPVLTPAEEAAHASATPDPLEPPAPAPRAPVSQLRLPVVASVRNVVDAARASSQQLAGELCEEAHFAPLPAGDRLAAEARTLVQESADEALYESARPAPIALLSRECCGAGEVGDDDDDADCPPEREAPWYGSTDGPLAALLAVHLENSASKRPPAAMVTKQVARSRTKAAPAAASLAGSRSGKKATKMPAKVAKVPQAKVTVHAPVVDATLHTPREGPEPVIGARRHERKPLARAGRLPPSVAKPPSAAKPAPAPRAGRAAPAPAADPTGGVIAQLAAELAELCGLSQPGAAAITADPPAASRSAVVRSLRKTLMAAGGGVQVARGVVDCADADANAPQRAAETAADEIASADPTQAETLLEEVESLRTLLEEERAARRKAESRAAKQQPEAAPADAEVAALREQVALLMRERAEAQQVPRADVKQVPRRVKPSAAGTSARRALRASVKTSSARPTRRRPASVVDDALLAMDKALAQQRQRAVRMFMNLDAEHTGSLAPADVKQFAADLLPGMSEAQLSYFNVMMAESGSHHERVTFMVLADAVRAGAEAASLALKRNREKGGAVSGRGASVGAKDALWRIGLRLQGSGAKLSEMFCARDSLGGHGALPLSEVVALVREATPLPAADARFVIASAHRAAAGRADCTLNEMRDALLAPRDVDFDPPRGPPRRNAKRNVASEALVPVAISPAAETVPAFAMGGAAALTAASDLVDAMDGEPAVELVAEPAVEPVADRAVEPVPEPAGEPVPEPAAEPVTEPAVEPAAKDTAPAELTAEEPATEPEAAPEAEAAPAEEPSAAEPATEPEVEPAVEAEPTAEPEPEPAAAIERKQSQVTDEDAVEGEQPATPESTTDLVAAESEVAATGPEPDAVVEASISEVASDDTFESESEQEADEMVEGRTTTAPAALTAAVQAAAPAYVAPAAETMKPPAEPLRQFYDSEFESEDNLSLLAMEDEELLDTSGSLSQ